MLNIEATMKVMNDQRKSSAQNMRLGAFIKALETRPQDQRIALDFCGMTPEHLDSYRGYYEDLAFRPGETYSKRTVAEVLQEAKKALGATFTGYKGGDFTMDENTLLWVSPYGESHQTAIVGITGDDYETIIETQWLRS